VEIRQARAEELPLLAVRLAESGGEQIDLQTARVFVAVEDGQILGMLSLRMTWQAEPLLLFGENTQKRRRAGIGLYHAMGAWIQGPDNRSGIRWLFAITRKKAVMGWLGKLGWFRQYKGAATFLKYL
jgi:hypothetical protein